MRTVYGASPVRMDSPFVKPLFVQKPLFTLPVSFTGGPESEARNWLLVERCFLGNPPLNKYVPRPHVYGILRVASFFITCHWPSNGNVTLLSWGRSSNKAGQALSPLSWITLIAAMLVAMQLQRLFIRVWDVSHRVNLDHLLTRIEFPNRDCSRDLKEKNSRCNGRLLLREIFSNIRQPITLYTFHLSTLYI